MKSQTKLTVDLDELEAFLKWKSTVNNTKLENIQWVRNGKEVQPNPRRCSATDPKSGKKSYPLKNKGDVINHWNSIGLTNLDFAQCYILPRKR